MSSIDGARADLREAVAAIDRQMIGPTDELRASWARLVDLLALGPPPVTRECPVCRHTGMRAATRCGYCWTALPPLAG